MSVPSTITPPAHVPPELVRPCPFLRRGVTSQDPFKTMIGSIHAEPRIFWSPDAYPGATPAWVLRRYEDLRAVYLDTEHFSNHGLTPFSRLIGESWVEIPVELDPPVHHSFRMMLNAKFSPRSVKAMADTIRENAARHIATLAARGGCEFMADFATPFPVTIMLDLLNLPHSDMDTFMRWEKALLHGAEMSQVAGAVRELKAYMLGVIDERLGGTGEDLISFGINGTIDGRPLNADEMVGYCFNLFVGGLDTVTSALGLQFRYLAEAADQQERLRADPGLIPAAMEEMFRAFSPASTFRICVKDKEINGVTIRAGDKVAMSPAIAGRDPEAFERPGEIDFSRRSAHVAFAYGPHLCLGMHLARLEIQVAIEAFLKAIPTFRVAPGAVVQTQTGGVVQPVALPLVW